MSRPRSELDQLLGEIRACRICEASLPLGPRPVLRAGARALRHREQPAPAGHDARVVRRPLRR